MPAHPSCFTLYPVGKALSTARSKPLCTSSNTSQWCWAPAMVTWPDAPTAPRRALVAVTEACSTPASFCSLDYDWPFSLMVHPDPRTIPSFYLFRIYKSSKKIHVCLAIKQGLCVTFKFHNPQPRKSLFFFSQKLQVLFYLSIKFLHIKKKKEEKKNQFFKLDTSTSALPSEALGSYHVWNLHRMRINSQRGIEFYRAL